MAVVFHHAALGELKLDLISQPVPFLEAKYRLDNDSTGQVGYVEEKLYLDKDNGEFEAELIGLIEDLKRCLVAHLTGEEDYEDEQPDPGPGGLGQTPQL